MKVYKLTGKAPGYKTHNGTKWGRGVTHKASGDYGLCSSSVIHAYEDPLLALFMNPIHGNIEDPVVWEAEAKGEILNDGTKLGVKGTVTTIKIIPLVAPSVTQRILFAILTALEVYRDPNFVKWAGRWLSGVGHGRKAAAMVAEAAEAAEAVWVAEAVLVAEAAEAAARAAEEEEAVWAAEAAEAAEAVCVAEARAAVWAGRAAAAAFGASVVGVGKPIDLIAIARKAMAGDVKMRQFSDLKFSDYPAGMWGIRAVEFFKNGYGCSITKTPRSYGVENDLYELAVLEGNEEKFSICTENIIGGLTEKAVEELLNRVEALPKRGSPCHCLGTFGIA